MWSVQFDDHDRIVVDERGEQQVLGVEGVREMQYVSGLLWTSVMWRRAGQTVLLRGLTKQAAEEMQKVLSAALAEHEEAKKRAADFQRCSGLINQWWQEMRRDLRALADRWIPREALQRWQAQRPDMGLEFLAAYQTRLLQSWLNSLPQEIHTAIDVWRRDDLPRRIDRRNRDFLHQEKTRLAEYFATVERRRYLPGEDGGGENFKIMKVVSDQVSDVITAAVDGGGYTITLAKTP